MKWVPVQMLGSREEVRLLEEDVGELQSLAIEVEDFEWFGDLKKGCIKCKLYIISIYSYN